MIFFILLISFFANANPSTGVEIYSAEVVQESKTKTSTGQSLIPQKRKPTAEPKKRAVLDAENTNQLPSYFADNHHAEIKSKVILSTETRQEKLMSVRAGDTAQIEILHSIIAFPDEKAPVVAVIKSGALTGAKLFGSSTLEKNSKRIFIEFERASFAGSTYELKGSAITSDGIQGFMGEHHSRESEYFAGDFISSFVAAYFDAQVPRTTNAFGQIQDDRSVDSAFKKGLSASAMSSAERFKEKLKKVPEFSELAGPIRAKILIFEGGNRL